MTRYRRPRMALALFLLVWTTTPIAVGAATIAQQAQALMQRSATQDGPGLAVLIAKGDNVIFRDARGRAQIELGMPLSADQVFRIASVTKMFTAAMVLKLAALGQLSIDDTLAKYLPDFPGAGQITLRQLLGHTSGVSDIVSDVQPGFSRRDVNTAALIAEIRKRPPDFSPGARWAYSNAGYILLGAVIEKVMGKPWHEAMRGELFDAAKLSRTGYGSHSTLIAGRVSGYTTDPQTHQVANASFINSSVPAAAGGLVSDADDLWRWMRALAAGRVIGQDGFKQMITPGPDLPGISPMYRYGLGMYLWRVRGSAMVGHTGQINGFASFVGYLPAEGITIVALTNDDTFDARTMGMRLAAIALGKPFPNVVGVTISEEMLHKLAGTYRADDGSTETLSIKDGTLYAQRDTRMPVPLQMTAERHLHFVPDELSYFLPVYDDGGKIVRLDYFADEYIPLPSGTLHEQPSPAHTTFRRMKR